MTYYSHTAEDAEENRFPNPPGNAVPDRDADWNRSSAGAI